MDIISKNVQPGGLDVPSTIGSATALLAGLLAGDENFGKVLGNYVGKFPQDSSWV